LIMRLALRFLDEHSVNAVMIGDRMDTDMKVGLESGLETILVLSGVTSKDTIVKFPYRPRKVVNSVADIQP
jgi:NagD protein